ncbi:hypothetical protein QTP70_019315 [Hemibagrus guttatus]|uniref:Reverse transcriptase domain-containing protein n=1 Tax=Hemibagrus guttatus TaxID=175788 RepID=A0AAE0QUU7_9TELE|nr:hypothetical protein QTP70_019315 [Hemibagrus guttatus]
MSQNLNLSSRRAVIRVSIELQLISNPIPRRDLIVRLTDDADLYFLYNLLISEEDFQSLKVQQGLLIDFTAFPQKFIDLLEQCISEQSKENPRFLLQLSSPSSALNQGSANLNIVETNAFKHLTHLSLKLLPGSDVEIKKYLATCLASMKITGLNDYRPVALTSVVMKSFERLVLSYLKDITDPLLDPLQFAYRSNRPVDDAVNMALHFILQHLDSPGSYARILFVDFSSAFNTIIPALLRDKLFQLNVPDSMCSWITDFLTDRRQFVRLGTHVSDLQHISTGSPQGCVLSPLLFSLYTNGCTFGHQSVKLLKFADDTTLIGLISDGDESAYRGEIDRLVSWCSMNNLELNSLKTVEMTVDFRKNPAPHPPVILCDSPVSSAESFCFLGTTITKELKWEQNIRSLTKKAQQKFLLPVKMLVNSYTAIIESEEKEQLQQKLRKTEEDLTRQLNYTQQTLSEKSRELDKLRSEWTSQTSTMSSRHTQDLTAEREKALEIQTRLQQQNDQLRRELEATHQRSTQQLQTRLAELETSNRELTEKKYKSDSTIRDLKAKLLGLEEESQRMKQQVTSLRRENGTLDTECHEKERLVNQLQTRVAVLEQEIKDKDQLILRTKEVLEATQQQKTSVEETAECKQLQIGRLESTVKSLSEELIKANGIIKKLQGDLKALVGKIKVKNTVTVSQEKVLQETTDRLQREQRELQDTQHRLRLKEDEVSKLQEQLESTVKKLDESKEVLKTNENVITWLNKQLNENQLSRKQDTVGVFETPQPGAGLRLAPASHNMLESKTFSSLGQPYPVTSTLNSKHSFPLSCVQFNPMSAKASMSPVQGNGNPAALQLSSNKENGEPLGLDSKYFERRDESIPLRGLVPSMHLNKEIAKPSSNMVNAKPTAPSAYFPV